MEIDGHPYRSRIIDPIVDLHLRAFGAVEIVGAMWAGKTWTARAHGASMATFDERRTRELADLDVDAVLAGARPRVLDEWQQVPAVWDAVRGKVDASGGERGLFLLTGSSRPAKGETVHTGSGRISRVRMWPMTLSESGYSNGSVSLADLFDGRFAPSPVRTDLTQLATLICRGGWPAAVDLDEDAARLVAGQYLDALVTKQDPKAPGNERELRMFLGSLARNIGSSATLKTIARDMRLANDAGDVADTATRRVRDLVNYFLDRYIIDDLHGWDAPIKATGRLRTKPKHGFADPSLPAALLGVGPQALIGNLQLFGQLFEELCLRDLRVYASALPMAATDPLRYYRDADGLEVDAVIELADGRWGAVEIKLGANKADAGARSLLRLKNKIALNPVAQNPEPSFLLVLVGKTDYQYRTPDGVIVAPITELTA